MPYSGRLQDWEASDRVGRVGRQLARWGLFLSALGALASIWVQASRGGASLPIFLAAIAPGVITSAIGLVLLAHHATYRGPDRWRWWNWLTWRT